MHRGSLPHSIELPASPIESGCAPDGLTEAHIDALIAEVATEVKPARPRPTWLSADQVETRRARHRAREVVRSLAASWLVAGQHGQGKSLPTGGVLWDDGEAA
jgi:hypothetical protein